MVWLPCFGLRSVGLRSVGLRCLRLRGVGLLRVGLHRVGLICSGVLCLSLLCFGLRDVRLRDVGLRSFFRRRFGLGCDGSLLGRRRVRGAAPPQPWHWASSLDRCRARGGARASAVAQRVGCAARGEGLNRRDTAAARRARRLDQGLRGASLGLLLLVAAAASIEPAGAAGPGTATGASGSMQTVDMELGGRRTLVDLYLPAGTPRGAVVVIHGFTRTRASMAGYGELLVRDGLLVAVPDQPYLANARGNAQAAVDLVAALRDGPYAPPLTPVVLIGFSAGGLAALLAANSPGVVGVIGLDPFDRPGSQPGLAAAPGINTPVLLLRAPPAACNAFAIAAAWATALPRLVEDRVVAHANHCDFEWPTDWICRLACGIPDAAREQSIREALRTQVTRWLPLP